MFPLSLFLWRVVLRCGASSDIFLGLSTPGDAFYVSAKFDV
jgi:hypothetical protein